MMRVCLHLVLLGSIAAAMAPARGLAQPAQVDKKQVAKQYVDAGLAAQSSGDYDTAITLYQKAYQLVPHPVLIFNIAQAHRLAGRVEQALTLYKRYLSEDPNGSQARTARDLVAEIEAKKAEEAHEAEEAKKAEEARKAEEVRKAEEAKKAEEVKARELEAQRATPPGATPPGAGASDASSGRTLRIAGIAAGAGGAAALIVGTGFGLHARALSSELSKMGATYDPSKVSSGQHANTIAIAGFAGGGALVAAGAALYWWGYTHDRPGEELSLAPMVSGDAAGLVLSGRLP